MKGERFVWYTRVCSRCERRYRTMFRRSRVCPVCDHSQAFKYMNKRMKKMGLSELKVMI